MSKFDLHAQIAKELTDLYIRKNTDYGDSIGVGYKELGPISILTRMTDKMNRLKNLVVKGEKTAQVSDESIDDTLQDLANYAIIFLVERYSERESMQDIYTKLQKETEVLKNKSGTGTYTPPTSKINQWRITNDN